MPTFSDAELAEIKKNTEEIEEQRKQKKSSPDAPKKRSSKRRKKGDSSLVERLVAPIMLLITLGIAVAILVWG